MYAYQVGHLLRRRVTPNGSHEQHNEHLSNYDMSYRFFALLPMANSALVPWLRYSWLTRREKSGRGQST